VYCLIGLKMDNIFPECQRLSKRVYWEVLAYHFYPFFNPAAFQNNTGCPYLSQSRLLLTEARLKESKPSMLTEYPNADCKA
jgi:hypothetical protein